MKKSILIVMVIAGALLAFTPVGMNIKIKGSDTVLPLSQKEAEVYMKANKDAKITVIGGGSGVGIAALLDGTTDIAMSSRKMKLSEKSKLLEGGKFPKEVTICFDALSVIVNPGNKVSQLTREQIEGIFTGKITNWKEVGGDDEKIVAYSRESSSGTFEFFKEHVMSSKNYGSSVLLMPATGAIVQSVSQTKGAIGYIGLAYMEKTVKDVKVSYDKGKTYVEATVENAKNKSYPITRPLYYYYLSTSENTVKPFVDYILSAEGQKNVAEVGYVPLK
jgi:phosphate transport system substrate-binding protein